MVTNNPYKPQVSLPSLRLLVLPYPLSVVDVDAGPSHPVGERLVHISHVKSPQTAILLTHCCRRMPGRPRTTTAERQPYPCFEPAIYLT
jgi:hypothetical protein